MTEQSPSQTPGPDAYPHHLDVEVTAPMVAEHLRGNPDMYHKDLDPHLVANGIPVDRSAEQPNPMQTLETAAVVEAEAVQSHDWSALPPVTKRHADEHEAIGRGLDPSYDEHPSEVKRAIDVAGELGLGAEKGTVDAVFNHDAITTVNDVEPTNWTYDNGELHMTDAGTVNSGNQADELLRKEGIIEDPQLAEVIATVVNGAYDAKVASNAGLQAALDKMEDIPITAANAKGLEVAKGKIRARMDLQSTYTGTESLNPAAHAVSVELAEREKQALEKAIEDRIEADKLPWTMPNADLAPGIMDTFKTVYENVATQDSEPAPGDMFKVAPPMQHEGSKYYAVPDEDLLRAGGIDLENRPFGSSLNYTRQELQQAGVFFVNRVGGGEQPLFGVPIPDEESEDGLFHVEDRSFLTRAEFEKVYKYQQENGYGLGRLDPADVQTDMLMFTMRPEGREPNARKGGGVGSRENKYGQVRSPFVDVGFLVKRGVETSILSKDGVRRINTTSIHLANGHPDYPGTSEMFSDEAAHDQKYMSAGEFVRRFYMPPPTKEQALASMQNGLPTQRERAWVSQWPE